MGCFVDKCVYLPLKQCVPPPVDIVGGGKLRDGNGGPVGDGLKVGGVVVVAGWLEGLHCRLGDARSRWSHMCSSWYFPRFLFKVGS